MGVIRLDKTTRRVLVKEGSEVPFSMGTAIKLNGIDTIIDNINVTLGDTYGIAFWVDIATLSAANLIGDIPASFINSVFMRGTGSLLIHDNLGVSTEFFTGLTTGKFSIVLSYSSGNLSVYVNGVLISTEVFNGQTHIDVLGSRIDSRFLDGKLNEVVFMNGYAPTAQDAIDYNAANQLATNIFSNVVRYYRCNDADGTTTLTDAMGNQNADLTNFDTPFMVTW